MIHSENKNTASDSKTETTEFCVSLFSRPFRKSCDKNWINWRRKKPCSSHFAFSPANFFPHCLCCEHNTIPNSFLFICDNSDDNGKRKSYPMFFSCFSAPIKQNIDKTAKELNWKSNWKLKSDPLQTKWIFQLFCWMSRTFFEGKYLLTCSSDFKLINHLFRIFPCKMKFRREWRVKREKKNFNQVNCLIDG